MNGAYRRMLLKLSGEGLAGAEGEGIDPEVIGKVARQIKAVHDLVVPSANVRTPVVLSGPWN